MVHRDDYETVANFLNAVADRLEILKERWKDERDLEDFNGYLQCFERMAKNRKLKLVKMTKRPFGFTFSCHGRLYQMGCFAHESSCKLVDPNRPGTAPSRMEDTAYKTRKPYMAY